MALSRPREHPSDMEPEGAGPSMFSPKFVGNKVPAVQLCSLGPGVAWQPHHQGRTSACHAVWPATRTRRAQLQLCAACPSDTVGVLLTFCFVHGPRPSWASGCARGSVPAALGVQVKDRLKAMMHAGQSFTGRTEPDANGGTDVDEAADVEAGVR